VLKQVLGLFNNSVIILLLMKMQMAGVPVFCGSYPLHWEE
jgi:hypothetical protein